MDTKNKLSKISLALHWLIAAVMIIQLASGFIMAGQFYHLYEIHKSIGVAITLFVIWRIVWRMKNGWPVPLYEHHEKLVKAAHGALLFCTLMMPLTGMLYSGASGHGFGLMALRLFPENHDLVTDKVEPFSEFYMSLGLSLHTGLGYALVALVLIHVIGALKHHFMDHDGTLKRMLGKTIN